MTLSVTPRRPAEAAPRRMRPLAKLPVFLNLVQQRAVVAGGSAAAAWKAELLASTGALVDVYSDDPSEDMQHIVSVGCRPGALTLHRRVWTPADLEGASVAIADLDDDAEALDFTNAARAAGAPFNVIDKPAFCQFQFGAIVNRSPAVIAISTDGAAPILGQAIRRRIETLLPQSLADWTALAKSVRDSVAKALPKGQPRRRFWERFAERAFGSPPNTEESRHLETLIGNLATEGTGGNGRVTLVGAGPGDAELLTLKAVRALQSADVILFDDLVSDDVLELARREAKRMLVGKRGGRDSCRQDDINALMVTLARQGRHVVRLKSGDPMIFGRAGEEIAELERNGIPVSVVPGITSALAAASRLGVSLTHRDHAQSVRFVTGHSRHGDLPSDFDWRGLADPATTLVFYMGGRTASRIASRLIDEGLATSTPVSLVAAVSRAEERALVCRLGELASGGIAVPFEAPVLIGIGQVFEALLAAQSTSPRGDVMRQTG